MVKNATENAIKAVTSLHMVCPKSSENQNSEFAANINEIAHLNLHLMNNVTIEFIKILSFLKTSQNSQVIFIKIETPTQVFYYEFCKTFQNIFFIEHLYLLLLHIITTGFKKEIMVQS